MRNLSRLFIYILLLLEEYFEYKKDRKSWRQLNNLPGKTCGDRNGLTLSM